MEKLEISCRVADKWTSSCHKLGFHYLNGTGGAAKDAAEAAATFQKSCEPDAAFGASLLLSACDTGHAVSCFHLAGLHERGEGVTANDERATALFAKACEGGHQPACDR